MKNVVLFISKQTSLTLSLVLTETDHEFDTNFMTKVLSNILEQRAFTFDYVVGWRCVLFALEASLWYKVLTALWSKQSTENIENLSWVLEIFSLYLIL